MTMKKSVKINNQNTEIAGFGSLEKMLAATSPSSIPDCRFSCSRFPTSGYSNCVTRKQHVAICSLLRSQLHASDGAVECTGTNRREAMLRIAFSVALNATALAVSSPAHSLEEAPDDFRLFSDDVNKYIINIPQDWEVGIGETDGIKSITGFFPNNDRAAFSNVTVAVTGIGPDFTKLESFGKVDEFAESLVNGLDRSWQKPPGLAAQLIDSRAKNGLYYVEYTLKNPGESQRHIYSAIGMASNGWYNRLYTVTGQFVEGEADKFSSKIQKTVQSFRLN